MRIMFIGRFQPFHRGHLEAVRYISNMGEVMIAVGSAQYSDTFRNPFTFSERESMIKAALEEADIGGVEVVPVKDIHNHQRWAEHVKASVPHYDAVFTNSEVDRSIFSFAGDIVLGQWLYERGSYEGKKVREALASGSGGWRALVPPAVAVTLEDIGAEERLRRFRDQGRLEEGF